MLKLKIEGQKTEIVDFLQNLAILYQIQGIHPIDDFANFSVTFCKVLTDKDRRVK